MSLSERDFFNQRAEEKPATLDKLRDYLIRVDAVLGRTRCQRTFDIPSQLSLVFL